MSKESNLKPKMNYLKLEESLKNLYISLKYKMTKEEKKPNISEYNKKEFEKLKKVDMAILIDYLKEMIDIYADFKSEKALYDNNQKIREESINRMDLIKNDVEIYIEEKEFDCLTIKNEITHKNNILNNNFKCKDYLEYEEIIKKLEAEIRDRIQVIILLLLFFIRIIID